MKRYLPLLFGLITLVFINSNIIKQQQLIKNGTVMFVELRPVDPRSLLQGDYMELSYKLNIDSGSKKQTQADYANAAISLLDYRLVVTLDDKSTVISATFIEPAMLSDNQHLLIVKKSANRWGKEFYPASDSFLFAEGLAYCYEKAAYAELRVNKTGQPLLYRLNDENRKPLDCESKQRDEKEALPSLF